MKWKYESSPVHGQERIVRRFLLWPKYIGGQARWLETAEWLQEFDSHYPDRGWHDLDWVD